MPTYSAYPVAADVTAQLAAAGFTLTTENVAGQLQAAIDWWEDATSFVPFLVGATDTPTTRSFQIFDKNVITFDGGLIVTPTIPATVTAGTYDQNDNAVSTLNYTANTHFRYKPDNAPSRGRPYTYLQVTQWYWQRLEQQRSVTWAPIALSITGLWGHSTTLRGDAWNAIVQKAAAGVLRVSVLGRTGVLRSLSQEGVSESYGGNMGPHDFITAWEAAGNETVKLFKRVTV